MIRNCRRWRPRWDKQSYFNNNKWRRGRVRGRLKFAECGGGERFRPIIIRLSGNNNYYSCCYYLSGGSVWPRAADDEFYRNRGSVTRTEIRLLRMNNSRPSRFLPPSFPFTFSTRSTTMGSDFVVVAAAAGGATSAPPWL